MNTLIKCSACNRIVYINKKILCKNGTESLEVQNKFLKLQKKLLNLDCIWRTTNKIYYLFFLEGINVLTPMENYKDWVEATREELTVQDLLNIQIKEEKPKFDPNTLKVFDKVLVRDDENRKWTARFFDFYEKGRYYVTNGSIWKYCIPYNDDTKHLHKTSNAAPEYYQIEN